MPSEEGGPAGLFCALRDVRTSMPAERPLRAPAGLLEEPDGKDRGRNARPRPPERPRTPSSSPKHPGLSAFVLLEAGVPAGYRNGLNPKLQEALP